jgi:hypothetical protein
VSASKEHDLITAMVARYVQQQGYELVALDCSLDWLFGDSFRLPPSIIIHRPDVLGVRDRTPFVCIGEAKTRGDMRSARTRQQLKDFAQASAGKTAAACEVVVGIPSDCQTILDSLINSLGIAPGRITVIAVPRPLLEERKG